MAEDVNTGGLIKFRHTEDYNPKMSDEEKGEIKKAYEKYYERKKRENRNKIILYIIIGLVIIGLGTYLALR